MHEVCSLQQLTQLRPTGSSHHHTALQETAACLYGHCNCLSPRRHVHPFNRCRPFTDITWQLQPKQFRASASSSSSLNRARWAPGDVHATGMARSVIAPALATAAVLLLVSAAIARNLPPSTDNRPHRPDECIFEQYTLHPNISAWEFQAQPHRHHVSDRAEAIRKVESLLAALSTKHGLDVLVVPDSRWMAIFREHTFQISTRHGHTLNGHKRLQFCGVAYLRLRTYEVLTPAGAYVPSAMPGTADLTIKMKKVNPDVGVTELAMAGQVGGAQLSAKMEQDLHCDHQRATFSPIFKPVSAAINISTLEDAQMYFTNVAQMMRLDTHETLPFIHDVRRAKVVWTVVVNGVLAEANLVIKYNTTLQDAVLGVHPKNGEFSLRIRREVAQAGVEQLKGALNTIALAMQVFRNHGWDGKTPDVNTTDPPSPGRHAGTAPLLSEYDEDLGEWVTSGDASDDLEHDDSRCAPAAAPDGPPPASPAPHHHHGHGCHGKHGCHHGHSSKGSHHHHGGHHHDSKHPHGHDHHHTAEQQQQQQHEEGGPVADVQAPVYPPGSWRWWDVRQQQPAPLQQQRQQKQWSQEVLTIVEM